MDQAGCEGIFVPGLGATQPDHVADDPHGVGIHGVNVEKVVLHLANDLAKLREIAPEHVVLLHGRQRLIQGMGRSE